MPAQESNKNPQRVLCVTFGAPPLFTTPKDLAAAQAEAGGSAKTALFWNFLLMHSFGRYVQLADLMPAVLSTRPASTASANNWLVVVKEIIQKVQDGDVNYLPDALKDLAAAGQICFFSVL